MLATRTQFQVDSAVFRQNRYFQLYTRESEVKVRVLARLIGFSPRASRVQIVFYSSLLFFFKFGKVWSIVKKNVFAIARLNFMQESGNIMQNFCRVRKRHILGDFCSVSLLVSLIMRFCSAGTGFFGYR